MFKKNIKFYLIALLICVFAISGVVLADTIVNNYYGNVDLEQTTEAPAFGAVTAIGGICDGSEPTTQLCNVNVYEIESQTTVTAPDVTVSDDLVVTDDASVGGNLTVTGQLGNLQGFAGEVLSISTTSATRTLTETEMLAYTYFKVTANTAGGFALTLPATSTMTTIIPNAGDYKDICIENATSSTQALTITAGTGIRLVASTNAMDVIDETEVSCIRFIRESDTDVIGIMTDELVDVD